MFDHGLLRGMGAVSTVGPAVAAGTANGRATRGEREKDDAAAADTSDDDEDDEDDDGKDVDAIELGGIDDALVLAEAALPVAVALGPLNGVARCIPRSRRAHVVSTSSFHTTD
jgi:hypothetical protein